MARGDPIGLRPERQLPWQKALMGRCAGWRWLKRQGHLLALALAMALMLYGEHKTGLHRDELQARSFAVLPLIAGIFCLAPCQELLLGGLFLASTLLVGAGPTTLPPGEFLLRSLARVLLVGLCVWLSRQRLQLRDQASELRRQLLITLQTSALAHEIHQPLTLIQLESRRLLRQLEQQDAPHPEEQAGLERIHAATLQLGQTVAAVANLLRREPEAHRRVDLSAVLLAALEQQQHRLQQLGVVLCSAGLLQPQMIRGDAAQLGLAAANLLRNALDALETREPACRRLQVSLQHQRDQLELVVADSGPGLPPDRSGRLIRRSTKPQGMGLGLTLVHTIAAAHGGQLRMGLSQQLGGAELRLRLPACR